MKCNIRGHGVRIAALKNGLFQHGCDMKSLTSGVAVITYNGLKYLSQQLDSILAQTRRVDQSDRGSKTRPLKQKWTMTYDRRDSIDGAAERSGAARWRRLRSAWFRRAQGDEAIFG